MQNVFWVCRSRTLFTTGCTFSNSSTTFVQNRSNYMVKVRLAMDEIAKEHNIKEMTDWYNLYGKVYESKFRFIFQSKFNSSPILLLSKVFPRYEWLPWQFKQAPRRFWQSHQNQRQFLDWAEIEMGIKDKSDWYQKSKEDLLKVGGVTLLYNYNMSLLKLLTTVYNDYDWLPWRFVNTPMFSWNKENHRKFIIWAGQQLNIKEMSDWYKVTSDELINLGGVGLLNNNTDSVYKVVSAVYPEYDWLPWKFEKTPQFYLDELKNQRKFMDEIAKTLKIKDLSDWYKLSVDDLKKAGAGTLLLKYSNSFYNMLVVLYPENEWLPWKFAKSPQFFWNDLENQRKFMDWAGKQLQIKEMSDWYKVSHQSLIDLGGTTLLQKYKTFYLLLQRIYPDYKWLAWNHDEFRLTKSKMKDSSKLFVEMVYKEMNMNSLKDWYKLTKEDIRSFKGGDIVLQAFNDSIYKLLKFAYPDEQWLPWKFDILCLSEPNNWWLFLEDAAKELNVKEMNDWYNVKTEQIIDLGGGYLIIKHSSLAKLLSVVYSDIDWESNRFPDIWNDKNLANYFVEWLKKQNTNHIPFVHNLIKEIGVKGDYPLLNALQAAFPSYEWTRVITGVKKSSSILKQYLQLLFPNSSLLEVYKHPDVSNLELDYFLPKSKLAFEYQRKLFSTESRDAIDKRKEELCKKLGITLIFVPSWWDKKVSSLAATIYSARPDLFADYKPNAEPIPKVEPEKSKG